MLTNASFKRMWMFFPFTTSLYAVVRYWRRRRRRRARNIDLPIRILYYNVTGSVRRQSVVLKLQRTRRMHARAAAATAASSQILHYLKNYTR